MATKRCKECGKFFTTNINTVEKVIREFDFGWKTGSAAALEVTLT